MKDPTLDEMRVALGDEYALPLGDECEIAMYWFACNWHGGQGSNLYVALCASPYSPGPLRTFERDMVDDPLAYEIYDFLENTYA